MRVVITGASGNVGTALLSLLRDDLGVSSIVGVARRADSIVDPRVEWRAADVSTSDLRPILDGADAVVHLAWNIQPAHREQTLWQTNVLGSRRVFEAAAATGVSTIVYASSVGAYSPKPTGGEVDESWPVDGTPSSFYARHKAMVEWLLGSFQTTHPEIRVVSLRPSLIFRREAATGVRRLFMGPLFPASLLEPGRLPAIPNVPGGLRFQATHSEDVASAFAGALHRPVSGAFNIAAEPVLDFDDVAEILETRTFAMPLGVLRAAASATWSMRLQPTPPGWVDMAAAAPIMSSERARHELGWQPRHSAKHALRELLVGMAAGADYPTPPLSRVSSGIFRHRELTRAAIPRSW